MLWKKYMSGRMLSMVIRLLNLDRHAARGDYQHMNTILKADTSMTMNSEKWAARLKHLELTHLEMDTRIKKMEQLRVDSTHIRDMKKQKLKLKEQIENIRKDLNI